MILHYQGLRHRDMADPAIVEMVENGDLHGMDFPEWQRFVNLAHKFLTLESIAYLGAVDRFYLFTQILERKDGLHPWLYNACREVELDPDGYIDLWAREHYKSTLITYVGAIQEIINNPEITIGIFSHTQRISQKFAQQIKREFESNHVVRTIYNDICWIKPRTEAPVWSSTSFTVRRKSNPKEATVEAWGLIEGQPTSKHFLLRIYDDVVTRENVTNPEMVRKTTEAYELSDNLGANDGRQWLIGTRYCSTADMRITMADWSQRPIDQVSPGDFVVGWQLRDGKRYLVKSKVLKIGCHPNQPVNRYNLSNGRAVKCTADHRWWRGAHGGGPEYAPLALPPQSRKDRPVKNHKHNGHLVALRELLTPVDPDQSREAGWLAGFFDGEGTMKLNKGKNRVSGMPCIIQSLANPQLIDEARRILSHLNFEYSENWWYAAGRDRMRHDRCTFSIRGGWRERYRFMAQIAPRKHERLADSLFASLTTKRVKLESVEPIGNENVYWLETETGNYVIEGFCSSNSFGDTYGELITRKVVVPRLKPATHNGKPDGRPVFLSDQVWERKKRTQKSTLNAQMLQNPLAGNEQTFRPEWFKPWLIRPAYLNIYIMGDPSRGKKRQKKRQNSVGSDNTAIAVVGVDANGNKFLLDGMCHRMNLSQRYDNLKHLHKKWSKAPGIGVVKVGWERYGLQSDDEYFAERMRIEGYTFALEELNWTNEGNESKRDRVERLQPDIEYSTFLFPGFIHSPGQGTCTWSVSAENAQIELTPLKGEMRFQRTLKNRNQEYLGVKPIVRRNEDGQIYDLTTVLMNELIYFPFAAHDDLCDATSRIYDMSPVAASIVDHTQEDEVFEDA